MEITQRIKWIDTAKAIGIFLVIIGHASLPANAENYIYTFHMPLFFFISGYLFKNTECHINSFIKKKFYSLIIPYILAAIITYIFGVLFNFLNNHIAYSKNAQLDVSNYPIDAICGTGDFNSPIWFLLCLFIVGIFFILITRLLKCKSKILFAIFISSLIGYFLGIHRIKIIWKVDTAFTAIVFYGIGSLLQQYKLKINLNKYLKLGLVLLFFIIGLLVTKFNGRVDMSSNIYNNYLLFYLGAFSGIITFILLSQLIRTNKFVLYIGQNTIIIMSFHILVLKCFQASIMLVGKIIFKKHLNLPLNTYWWSLTQSIAVLIILIPIIYIINKYLPAIAGKYKK